VRDVAPKPHSPGLSFARCLPDGACLPTDARYNCPGRRLAERRVAPKRQTQADIPKSKACPRPFLAPPPLHAPSARTGPRRICASAPGSACPVLSLSGARPEPVRHLSGACPAPARSLSAISIRSLSAIRPTLVRSLSGVRQVHPRLLTPARKSFVCLRSCRRRRIGPDSPRIDGKRRALPAVAPATAKRAPPSGEGRHAPPLGRQTPPSGGGVNRHTC
jgi:hypothetical protein